MKNGLFLLLFVIIVLGYGGMFVVYMYLVFIFEKLIGYVLSVVSILLLVYGVVVVIGNIIGGKVVNKNLLKVLFWMFLI